MSQGHRTNLETEVVFITQFTTTNILVSTIFLAFPDLLTKKFWCTWLWMSTFTFGGKTKVVCHECLAFRPNLRLLYPKCQSYKSKLMIPFGRKFVRGVGQSEWWSPHTLDTVSSHIWDSRMFLLVVFFTLQLGGRNWRKLSLLRVLELKQNILEFHVLQILNNWH